MENIFFEDCNLSLEVPSESIAFTQREPFRSSLGEHKIISLVAVLQLLRSRKSKIRIHVFGANATAIAGFLEEMSLSMFSTCDVSFADAFHPEDLVKGSIDMLVDCGSTEVEEMAFADHALQSVSDESIVFFSVWNPKCREDAIVSTRHRRRVLERHGLATIVCSYFAVFAKGFNFYTVELGQPLSVDEMRNCIFIFGHQRSASSLLYGMLNDIKDICLTFEANLHIPKNRNFLIENYNSIRLKSGRSIDKGDWLPNVGPSDQKLFEYIRTFIAFYGRFGDKIALGPRLAFYDEQPADRAFAFLTEHFTCAYFIVTARHPRSAIVASARMNQDFSTALILDWWIVSFMRSIDLWLVSPNAIFTFYERIVGRSVVAIERFLGIDLSPSLCRISNSEISTNDARVAAFWGHQGSLFADALKILSAVYDRVFQAIDGDTGMAADPLSRDQILLARNELGEYYAKILPSLQSL